MRKRGREVEKRTISRVRTLKAHFLSLGAPFTPTAPALAGSDERRVQSVSSRGSGKCRLRKLLETMDTPVVFWMCFLLVLFSGHSLDSSSQ
ncbi:hypothetical protein CDAR_301801 [Caerostris darwini]|uniref:Uncharacterized protein n=1 Tax=Caerostris darwini TaxID=1538125 RepID=A0AAV4VD77_9ARAC|nr:hypothetical protein CDAR_301801 [Caerostris darwini]